MKKKIRLRYCIKDERGLLWLQHFTISTDSAALLAKMKCKFFLLLCFNPLHILLSSLTFACQLLFIEGAFRQLRVMKLHREESHSIGSIEEIQREKEQTKQKQSRTLGKLQYYSSFPFEYSLSSTSASLPLLIYFCLAISSQALMNSFFRW